MQYSKFMPVSIFSTVVFSIVATVGSFFTLTYTPLAKYCGFGCTTTDALLFDSGFTFWLLVMIIGLVGLTFTYARVRYLEKTLTHQNETTKENT